MREEFLSNVVGSVILGICVNIKDDVNNGDITVEEAIKEIKRGSEKGATFFGVPIDDADFLWDAIKEGVTNGDTPEYKRLIRELVSIAKGGIEEEVQNSQNNVVNHQTEYVEMGDIKKRLEGYNVYIVTFADGTSAPFLAESEEDLFIGLTHGRGLDVDTIEEGPSVEDHLMEGIRTGNSSLDVVKVNRETPIDKLLEDFENEGD